MSQKTISSGHEVSVMDEKWLSNMEKEQTGYKKGMIKLLPEGWLLPTAFLDYEKKVVNFKVRPKDVLLMTMPKSGTTWTQEILWTMMHNPNLDQDSATVSHLVRSPHIDMDMLMDSKADIQGSGPPPFMKDFEKMCPGKNPEEGVFVQMLDSLPDPRLIKTHLPLALMPKDILDTTKVVYVARNPKDVAVSMCHHFRLIKIHNYTGTLEDFVRAFMKDDLLYCPYWPHVKLAWEKRHHPNLHFIFFEDMKADIRGEINKLNDFLGTGLSEQQLEKITEYTSFKSMKARGDQMEEKELIMNQDVEKAAGGFFRKGQSGDWKNNFSSELNEEMEKWIDTNASAIGIKFK